MFHHRAEEYTELCRKLGYSFKSKQLLQQALTRKTAVIEFRHAKSDYQRLEFLGDKVIGLAISTILFDMHPDWEEGRLTIINSQFTSNYSLAKLASFLELGKHLVLGRSDEMNNVRTNTKALADIVESIFGAIFLDSGKDYKCIEVLILKHWEVLGLEPIIAKLGGKEAESKLYQPEDDLDKALVGAVCSGTAEEVKDLLKKGAKPNVASEKGKQFRSALQFAANSKEAYDKMSLLLADGADPNWQTGYRLVDVRPMPRTVSISYLFKRGTYKRYFDQQTALHIIVKRFIRDSVDENEASRMINLLVTQGVAANLVDANGKTPLQLAYDYQSRIECRDEYSDTDDGEGSSDGERIMKLNSLIGLLERVSTMSKPTSSEKITQQIINAVQEDLLSTAFFGLPEEFGEQMLSGF